MDVSPLVKQLIVGISPMLAGLAVGGAVSFPTVLLHQLKAKDSTIHLDLGTASWIGAIHGIAGLPSIFMPTIMQWQGRKIAFMAACLISITGWILVYSARTATLILIGESFHGLGSNSIYAVTCLTITEMMAPKYRDSFIQLYYVMNCIAMAMSGLLLQYLDWKMICIVMCSPMVLAFLISCMWPESPYWLALKGEFEKCEQVFVWLRGTDADSMRELSALINAQKESIKDFKSHSLHKSYKVDVKKLWKKITSRDFYIPCFHIIILEYLPQGIGSLFIMIYSIELFKKATTNDSIVFFSSFIVNIILLIGFVTIISFNKYLKKKTVLLCSGIGAVVSLISAAITSYLQSIGVLSEDSIACLLSIIVYLVSISLGIMPLAYPIASALLPVRHRGIGGIIYVTNTCIFHTLALKLAPYMLLHLHLWGTFIVFAVNGISCGLIIWWYIPDTQGRTLQEIENFYKYGKFVNTKTAECLDTMIVT